VVPNAAENRRFADHIPFVLIFKPPILGGRRIIVSLDGQKKVVFQLGAWTGSHRAFALVANRCSAADAECLKQIRDSGDYKELDVNWEQFCIQYAGLSRSQAEQYIQCFEEYGDTYRRVAEVMSMAPGTFRLIAGSITDKGLEYHGEYIPLVKENRPQIAVAVKAIRAEHRAKKPPALATVASLQTSMEKLLTTATAIAGDVSRRAEIVAFLEGAAGRLGAIVRSMAA
jgi:hypothetical protein